MLIVPIVSLIGVHPRGAMPVSQREDQRHGGDSGGDEDAVAVGGRVGAVPMQGGEECGAGRRDTGGRAEALAGLQEPGGGTGFW
jgi:hypothetical protein